jgi:predicted nucleic acid-binding protein
LIFIDTSFFFAVFSARDRRHAEAMECLAGYNGKGSPTELFLTTNHVIFETLALIRKKTHHALTVAAGDELLSGQMVRIHQASLDEERSAFEYLRKHHDQKYSPIDCLSFVVMEKLGIAEALTFDGDFAHRFIARPRPA